MSSVNLEVSWSDIVAEFDKRYENSFSRSTAKAHLDFSNLTIDGPRHRWKHILLLDTLMCLFLGKEKKCEESNRRRFNQYRVLRECFVLVTSQALVNFQQKVDNMSSHRLMNSCELVNFPLEWKSNAILSKSLLSVGCSKSWNRIVSSVEDIFKKLGELSLEVNVLCQEVMNKLYIQVFLHFSLFYFLFM